MNFRSEPFRRFSSYANRYYSTIKPAQTTDLAKTALTEKLVSHKDLMFDFNFEALLDKKTGKVFTGKFVIPAGSVERICEVDRGESVGNYVRLKNGEKLFEEREDVSKSFKTSLSQAQLEAEKQKMSAADQKAFDEMTDTFIATCKERPDINLGYSMDWLETI